MGALGAFGRSKARRVEGDETKVTFKDVAGIDESKGELAEVVDFLKNPEKYQKLGGRIPRGVLLAGRPGHRQDAARASGRRRGGRAVLLRLRLGVRRGDRRHRRRRACATSSSRPRKPRRRSSSSTSSTRSGARAARGNTFGGGNDEREQTLNQILTEMDGFEQGDTVIVVGATNRAEILDAALLRPGRFDRRVTVPGARQGRPAQDPRGPHALAAAGRRRRPRPRRRDHARAWSARTSPTWPTRRRCSRPGAGTRRCSALDFTDCLEKIILGAPRGIVLSEEEKRRTAYHEAGHAIVGMLTPGADPVRKVSIIPRTMSLGVTISSPDSERTNYDVEYLVGRIQVALGGRIAEELVYGSISAGAESDIQQLTGIARQMVGRWGMSPEIGPIAVIPSEAQGPLLPGVSEVSRVHAGDDRPRGAADRRRGLRERDAAADRAPRQARQPDGEAARARDARHGRRLRGRGRPGPARVATRPRSPRSSRGCASRLS